MADHQWWKTDDTYKDAQKSYIGIINLYVNN